MVDEFQDTNAAAARAARARGARQRLHGRRRAAVHLRLPPCRRRASSARAGRAWRRAGRTAALATNFRSRPEILRALNGAFGPMHEHWVDLRPGRAGRPPRPRRWSSCWSPTPTPGTATRPVPWASGCRPPARSSRPRRGSWPSASPSSCTRTASRRATSSCCCAQRPRWASTSARWSWPGCPTLAAGGSGWWGRQQIRDLCHLLAALANPRDEEALLGLLASPHGRPVLRRPGPAGARRARGRHDDLGGRPRRRADPRPRGRAAPGRLPRVVRGRARARAAARPRRAPSARGAAHPLRPARARPAARRAAAGQRPQAAAHGRRLRGAPGPRRARVHRHGHRRARGRRPASPTRRSTSAASTPCA